MHDQTGSGFIYLSMIIAPVAYYRFGSWAICWLEDDKKKLQFLFISILLYLIPVLLLTIQDILIVGFVNESRYLLSDIGKEESTLSATIYGLMSSCRNRFCIYHICRIFEVERESSLLFFGSNCFGYCCPFD